MTEKCMVCGLRWHVCRDKKIPPGGYVCPRCEYRGRERPEGEHTYQAHKEEVVDLCGKISELLGKPRE